MVFNLFYIFRAKARKEKQRSRVDGWRREIAAQFAALETGGAVRRSTKSASRAACAIQTRWFPIAARWRKRRRRVRKPMRAI